MESYTFPPDEVKVFQVTTTPPITDIANSRPDIAF
jgi:hypothetical protein